MKTPAEAEEVGFDYARPRRRHRQVRARPGLRRSHPHPTRGHPGAAHRRRHHRPGRHRHRQDGGVRAADAAPPAPRRRRQEGACPARSCSCPRASWPCRWPKPSTSTRKKTDAHRGAASTAARRWISRFARCARGVDIVVATPAARSITCAARRSTSTALEVLVLDEADEMLDMGFAEDLEAILTSTPETRQTALFAATMAPRIASIAERHLREPQRITVESARSARPARCRASARPPTSCRAARRGSRSAASWNSRSPTSAIVFCRTRIEVDELTDTLKSHGYGAQALHGGLDQRQRDRVMQLFRSGQGRRARGHRRGRARARHRPRLARDQLRHPDRRPKSTCTASAAPDGSAAKAWRSRSSIRASSAPAHHRGADQAEDRDRQAADGGRSEEEASRTTTGRCESRSRKAGWTTSARSSSRSRRNST